MRFALVENQKQEPTPKLRGTCAHCGAEMIAKCGRVKVWHWAHKTREVCDPWWENETEWHRAWKNRFPVEWQEISHIDPNSGERHIADVKTRHGLVVEFQNSPMSLEELSSRESFYGNMIWIVNGLRNPLDAQYFQLGLSREPIQKNPLAYAMHWLSRGRLLHNWSLANAKVFLDFGDWISPGILWRLVLFDRDRNKGAVAPYRAASVFEAIVEGTEVGVPYLAEGVSGTREMQLLSKSS